MRSPKALDESRERKRSRLVALAALIVAGATTATGLFTGYFAWEEWSEKQPAEEPEIER